MSGKRYQPRVSYDLAETVLCDEVIVPPRYGGPTSPEEAQAAEDAPDEAETTAVAPPTAGAVGFALGGHVAGLDQPAVDAMRRAEMTWIKKQVRHVPGSAPDSSIIGQAHAQGFRVLIGALGDKNALAADFNGYVAQFSQFLASLASAGANALRWRCVCP